MDLLMGKVNLTAPPVKRIGLVSTGGFSSFQNLFNFNGCFFQERLFNCYSNVTFFLVTLWENVVVARNGLEV